MAAFIQRHLRGFLTAVAIIGLVAAWWRYPEENHFSILRCTISFLGSPDADHNPDGFRFYQVGMSAVVLLLFGLVWERHRRLRGEIGWIAACSSAAIFLALILIFLSIWIADTRGSRMFGMRTGDLHTHMAILAIPFMTCGILLDGVALRWRGVRTLDLWPFHLYGLIVLAGGAALLSWEEMCHRDPTLHHWPGPGIHSTPLWEWIVFTYLIAFLVWMAHAKFQSSKR